MVFSIAASQWTGLVKSLAESAYALGLNVWDTTARAVYPDYIVTSSAGKSRRSGTTITFTTTMPASAASTVSALAASMTAITMNANQNTIKIADGNYANVQPTSATATGAVVNITSGIRWNQMESPASTSGSTIIIVAVAALLPCTACFLLAIAYYFYRTRNPESVSEAQPERMASMDNGFALEMFPGAPPPGYTTTATGRGAEKQCHDKHDAQDSFSSQLVHLIKQHASGPLGDKAEEYAHQLVVNGIDDWSVIGAVSFEDLRLMDIPIGHARAIIEMVKDPEPEADRSGITEAVSTGRSVVAADPSPDATLDSLPFESDVVPVEPMQHQEGAFESDVWSSTEEET